MECEVSVRTNERTFVWRRVIFPLSGRDSSDTNSIIARDDEGSMLLSIMLQLLQCDIYLRPHETEAN